MSAVGKLAALSWRERALLVEAGVLLAGARLAVVALPFKTLAPRLGVRVDPQSAAPTPPVDAARLGRLTWAMGAVSARTPWRSMCLEQAIAAQAMLRRRRIPNTLYLGVARPTAGGAGPPTAHAWVRCGDVDVTGGNRIDHYAVVTTFAHLSPSRATRAAGGTAPAVRVPRGATRRRRRARAGPPG